MDDDGFTAFVEGSRAYLTRTAWLLTGDQHAAEDLVQETLVRVYLKWSKVRTGEELPYARRVLSNLSVDRWRRRRRERLVAEPPEHGRHGAEVTVDARDELVRALAALTARERAVVVLRHYADMTEQQVAADLGISVGTVKSTASRAMARIREVSAPVAPAPVDEDARVRTATDASRRPGDGRGIR